VAENYVWVSWFAEKIEPKNTKNSIEKPAEHLKANKKQLKNN
jgi:hypothetical protein